MRLTLRPPVLAAGLVVLGSVLLAAHREARLLRIREGTVALPRASARVRGVRLAFLADFHLGGPGPGEVLTAKALARLRTWRPDLILLGGDYFDQGRIVPTSVFDDLSDFPRVYAVLGNHDHRRGAENAAKIARLLESRGVTVLRNERVFVTVHREDGSESTLEVVGLDDPYTGLDDPSLLVMPPREDVPRVLLAHAPLLLERVPVGCADLALFGHTHWGQIRLMPTSHLGPLDAAWYLDRIRKRPHSRLQRGWFWERGMLSYVSAGIGVTQVPFRLFAPPEMLLLQFDDRARDDSRPCDDPRHFVRMAHS
ncbi:MAG: metallophosphoesterase [Thermomicrobium sp.]|nr:metallophosphoesterase [Thermomicrobium sp.]